MPNQIEDIIHGLPIAIARYKSLTNSDDDASELRLAERDLIRYAIEDGPTFIATIDVLLAKLDAAKSLLWMAERYAEGGGSRGVEMHEYSEAMKIIEGSDGK